MNASVPPRIVVPKWVDPPPLGGGGGGALPLLSPPFGPLLPPFLSSVLKLETARAGDREREAHRQGSAVGASPLALERGSHESGTVGWGGGRLSGYPFVRAAATNGHRTVGRFGFRLPLPPCSRGGDSEALAQIQRR